MEKYIEWKPGTHMRGYNNPYTYAIAELCNITVNALYAIDMDDKWIANVVYGILGIPNYKKYFSLEQSWYELN